MRSYGTEGRKATPADEIAPSDQVYEYIVFRGSDVKDLRIEESPPVKENKPPAVPNDPAILGVSTKDCLSRLATVVGRCSIVTMMKYFGCKTKHLKAQNPMLKFPLPSF